MNALSGISGLSGLGELPKCCKNIISQNADLIKSIYKKAEAINGFSGLGKLPAKQKAIDETNRVMSFDKVYKLFIGRTTNRATCGIANATGAAPMPLPAITCQKMLPRLQAWKEILL